MTRIGLELRSSQLKELDERIDSELIHNEDICDKVNTLSMGRSELTLFHIDSYLDLEDLFLRVYLDCRSEVKDLIPSHKHYISGRYTIIPENGVSYLSIAVEFGDYMDVIQTMVRKISNKYNHINPRSPYIKLMAVSKKLNIQSLSELDLPSKIAIEFLGTKLTSKNKTYRFEFQ